MKLWLKVNTTENPNPNPNLTNPNPNPNPNPCPPPGGLSKPSARYLEGHLPYDPPGGGLSEGYLP
jgi:hypothetical protein